MYLYLDFFVDQPVNRETGYSNVLGSIDICFGNNVYDDDCDDENGINNGFMTMSKCSVESMVLIFEVEVASQEETCLIAKMKC